MPRLTFISDSALEGAVERLLNIAYQAKIDAAKDDIGRNVIDPFSILFQMAGFGISSDLWKSNERNRQAEKTLQNAIGDFHQNILGSVAGWENLGVGHIIDLVCAEKMIIAEIKNKHNTVKGSDLARYYRALEDQVMSKNNKYWEYKAYHVEIIPSKPPRSDIEFTPSDNGGRGKCAANPLIRKIDGASFYTLVTGEENALSSQHPTVCHVEGQ